MIRSPVRFAVASLLVVATGLPAAALAQTAGAQAEATAYTPQTAALIAEIDVYGEADQSRDPDGDLVKLQDLAARVEANGSVPPMERGLLASAIGAAHFYARDYDKAADYYGAAAALFEEAHAPPEEMAGLYNNQATILASVGRYQEAEQSHRKALAIRREMEGERGPKVASSLFGLGYVFFRQGRVEESIPFFRELVEQQLEFVGPEDPQTIMRLTSLASVLGRSGREAEALQVARRAQSLGQQYLGEDHPTYAIVLNNLGNALIENGLYEEAGPVLRETLRVRQQTVGENASGTALSLRNLSTALKKTGHPAEAEEVARQALAIYEATGEIETPFALAYLYFELADFAAERRDWQSYAPLALRAISEADAKLEADNYDRAQIHLYHAHRLSQQGDTTQALDIAEHWVPIVQAALIPNHKDRIWAEMLLARLRQQAGAAGAWDIADAAMAQLNGKLGDLAATDLSLVREAETNRESALLYFEMALDAGDVDRVFAALQLVNISDLALGQQFATETRAAGEGAASIARRGLLDTARQIDELRNRYSASLEAADPAATEALASRLAQLEAEKGAAEADFRRDFPDYIALFRPQPVSLTALQAALGKHDLLIAPVEGNDRSWIVTVTRGDLQWHEADPKRISAQVAALRGSVDSAGAASGSFAFAEARALFKTVFPTGVRRGTRILFHGNGDLATVPLTMLLTADYAGDLRKAPWLVRDASFQIIGNLDLFGKGQAKQTTSRDLAFAGIGGPELPGRATSGEAVAALFRSGRPALDSISELPPLPDAERELRQIAAALPGDNDLLLIGPDAAEETFKASDLSKADIIVFATHGLVAGEFRGLWEPALLLGTHSADGKEDGLLGASEIARLRLDADWVILSACNTAGGNGRGGPLYSGLATAFSQAGARSLMLSHWRIRDDAASRLSVATVNGAVKGLDRAEALRRAQVALLRDSGVADAANPAVWAAFVIVQNW